MEDRKWREPLSSILYPPFSQLPSGDPSAVAPPVPIPNTEVKRCSPDGSVTIGCARVGRRQNPAPNAFRGWAFFCPVAAVYDRRLLPQKCILREFHPFASAKSAVVCVPCLQPK